MDNAVLRLERPSPTPVPARPRFRRICIITPDITGPVRNSGIGTACEALAKFLAEAGHEVTILYSLGSFSETVPIEQWVDHYAAEGVTLVPCPPAGINVEPQYLTLAWNVWRWIKDRDFDLIYTVEWRGHAFFLMVGKALGLAFADTPIVVGTHSPTLWRLTGNREFPADRQVIGIDHMERTTVALADTLVSPSHYMLDWLRGDNWSLPERLCVLPNPVPSYARSVLAAATGQSRIAEIVFFGRLETRKGLTLFAQALRRLPIELLKGVKVTFLGKRTGLDVDAFLADEMREPIDWQILDHYQAAEAVSYLTQPARIAVIPSLMDNSPMSVVECIGAGIPFLASAVGGIPELLREADRGRCLFPPHPAGLAQSLTAALSGGLAPALPSAEPALIDERWQAFLSELPMPWQHPAHATAAQGRPAQAGQAGTAPEISVVLVHRNRPATLHQAIDGLLNQTCSDFEVVLVDDGSDQPDALAALVRLEPKFGERGWRMIRQENSYLGAARNAGWRAATGRFVLFHDDDNISLPHQLASLIGAARISGADILTSGMLPFKGDHPPAANWLETADFVWLPLGGCIPLGLFENCFGDAQALVRREVLENLGGFTEDYGLGHEDWEFFARATLAGYRLFGVPEPLFWYRISADSMLRAAAADPVANFLRAARPYFELIAPPLRHVLLAAIASERRLEAVGRERRCEEIANQRRSEEIANQRRNEEIAASRLGRRLLRLAIQPGRIPRAMCRAAAILRGGGVTALKANRFPSGQ